MPEEMELCVFSNPYIASVHVANSIADVIRKNNVVNKQTTLGLATGETPIQIYDQLIKLNKAGISFRNVVTFNLDEYYPMLRSSDNSYHSYMHNHFFSHVDISPQNIHIPDGSIAEHEVDEYCESYEQKIADFGGIDIQILGIGRTGHIGFNEPGSSINSITRLVHLKDLTRHDAKIHFNGIAVPERAITMGIKTILEARKIYLLAWGEQKAEIIRKSFFQEISSACPASFLQGNKKLELVLDEPAAALIQSKIEINRT